MQFKQLQIKPISSTFSKYSDSYSSTLTTGNPSWLGHQLGKHITNIDFQSVLKKDSSINCASRAYAARGWSLLDEVLLVYDGFQSQPVIIKRRVECEIASSMQPKIQFDYISM